MSGSDEPKIRVYIHVYIYIYIYVHNVQISKIQVVCVSAGQVDESTSGANGLCVSGSLGGKVDELGKINEAFVV